MQKTQSRVRLRAIALPVEHGSWGLVLEPMLLGLLVAPSWAGVCLAVGTFAAFLIRQPFRMRLIGRRRSGSQRTVVAGRFVLLYSIIALVGFGGAFWLAGLRPFLPFLFAVPFVIIFLIYDFLNQSRSWQAELSGPFAFAMVSTSIALAGGWSFGPAAALAGVIIARAIPSILYIRARLRLDRGKPYRTSLVIGLHLIGLAFMIAFIWAELLPGLVAIAFLVLLSRAIVGLSTYRRPVPIKVIGFTEMGLGLLTVLTVVVGYYWA